MTNPVEHKEIENFSDTERAEWLKTGKHPDYATGPGAGGKRVAEEIRERREAIEKHRQEGEKTRRDWLAGKGKASDHVETISNRETVEKYTDQTGAPESVENLSESARELWLRTGDLPDKKPNGKAAEKKAEAARPPERPKMADYKVDDGQIDHERYEAALDKFYQDKTEFEKQQGAKRNEAPAAGELDKETFEEFKTSRADFWNEPEHAEAHKTFPERTVAAIQALSPEEKNVLATSPVAKMQLPSDLDAYLGHALSRVKNLGKVLVVLNSDKPLIERIVADWKKSEGNDRKRWESQQLIRFVLKHTDKAVDKMRSVSAANSTGEKPIRKLTAAGKPPLEAGGGTSSYEDTEEAALKRGDQDAFRRLANERDRKQFKSRHGRAR